MPEIIVGQVPGGVVSLNTLQGALLLTNGGGMTISASGTVITLTANPGSINQPIQAILASNATNGTNGPPGGGTAYCTGFGVTVPLIPTTHALVHFVAVMIWANTTAVQVGFQLSNMQAEVYLVRSTVGIPAGYPNTIPGGDVVLAALEETQQYAANNTAFAISGACTLSGDYYDSGLVVGTTYYYYLATVFACPNTETSKNQFLAGTGAITLGVNNTFMNVQPI
jgi:hypothetical protein